MNIQNFILAGVALALAFGGASVFFKKGGSKEASELDQNTIRAYKESETVKDKQIEALKIQVQTKDNIIERLLNDGRSSKKSSK